MEQEAPDVCSLREACMERLAMNFFQASGAKVWGVELGNSLIKLWLNILVTVLWNVLFTVRRHTLREKT